MGQQLRYRIDCRGNAPDLLGTVNGPNQEGEIRTALIRNTGRRKITGRLVDEWGKPLGLAVVSSAIGIEAEAPEFTCRRYFQTEEEGYFEFDAFIGFDGPISHVMSFWERGAEGGFERLGYLRFKGPPDEAPWHLGDVRMLHPYSKTALAPLSDEDLKAKFDLVSILSAEATKLACLNEMSRRGGDRWIEFLERELDRVSFEKYGPLNPRAADLNHLALLRRAQRRADPLAVTVTSILHQLSEFTHSPVARVRLENQDPGGESFFVYEGGSEPLSQAAASSAGLGGFEARSYVFDLFRVTGTNLEKGLEARRATSGWHVIGQPPLRRLLKPGESVEFVVPIRLYVDFERPGIYPLVIHYRQRDDFDRFDLAFRPCGEYGVEFASPPFEVTMEVVRVEAGRKEIDELDDQIQGYLSGRWNHEAEEAIVESGMKAVPLLFEALSREENQADQGRSGTLRRLLWKLYPFPQAVAWKDSTLNWAWEEPFASRLAAEYAPDFNGPGCAAADGFSLHANTRIALRDRDRLERLFRYAARPPIAQNRLRLDQSGKVVYFFRHAFRDGTTRIVLDPLSFIEKLAALIPAPKAHLVTYHGILAPASRLRSEVIPSPRAVSASRDNDFATVREERPATQSDQRRYKWAELLKRVFKIDILECEKCGGKRELIAVITQSSVIVAILDALDLPTTPPSTAPARASPFQSDLFS